MSALAQGSNNRKPIAAPRGDIVKEYTARPVVGSNGEADFTGPRKNHPARSRRFCPGYPPTGAGTPLQLKTNPL